jgi:hypothetical protein
MFRSDLSFRHDALALTGREVDKFVKQKADLMIHGGLAYYSANLAREQYSREREPCPARTA